MARLLVADDHGIPWVEITPGDGEGVDTVAWCGTCRRHVGSHRRNDPIEDHIQEAQIHVDHEH